MCVCMCGKWGVSVYTRTCLITFNSHPPYFSSSQTLFWMMLLFLLYGELTQGLCACLENPLPLIKVHHISELLLTLTSKWQWCVHFEKCRNQEFPASEQLQITEFRRVSTAAGYRGMYTASQELLFFFSWLSGEMLNCLTPGELNETALS